MNSKINTKIKIKSKVKNKSQWQIHYFANSVNLISRIIVTFICPGYSISS